MITESEFIERARKMKILVLDVDGVMTGGQIILDNNGDELKMFNVRDGHGIKMLQRAGVPVAIITGRSSKVVELRARELGIEVVYQGARDKMAAYADMKAKLGIDDAQAAYIGDDIVDIPVMAKAGLAIAVADAEPYVRDAAHLVMTRNGGAGAVREAIDRILMARGDWEDATFKYFS